MNKDIKSLETELMKNESQIEEFVDQIGELGFKSRTAKSASQKSKLKKQLEALKKEKKTLEKSSEKLVEKLCIAQELDDTFDEDFEDFDLSGEQPDNLDDLESQRSSFHL